MKDGEQLALASSSPSAYSISLIMSSFISQLESLVKADKLSLNANVAERRRALDLIRKLQIQLDSPVDSILRLVWQDTLYIAALKSCMDLKVFDILGESSDFVPIAELSKRTGANEALLARILRHVAAMGGIREKEPPLAYASTPYSDALRRKEINAGIDFIFSISAPVAATLPTWLEKIGYKDPLSSDDCCWNIAKHTDKGLFDYLNAHPTELATFAAHMSGYSEGRGIWLDLYPLSRILEGADPEGALLVDVGGGRGHDVERFRLRASQQQLGKIIVQDLPLVVEEAKKHQVDSSIEFIVHDFFTPQPVKRKQLSSSCSGRRSALTCTTQMREHIISTASSTTGRTMMLRGFS
jgi:O-methyltransferase domain